MHLSVYSAEALDWVAAKLNDSPRKGLEFGKPIELIGSLLLHWPPESSAQWLLLTLQDAADPCGRITVWLLFGSDSK